MSMLDEDEEYEDEVLHERRGTSVLRSAPPELVVPTPWMCRRWTGALNSRLWPRACAETGKRASMWQSRGPRFSGRCLGWFLATRCRWHQRHQSETLQSKFSFTFTFNCHPGKTRNHRSRGDTSWRAQTNPKFAYLGGPTGPLAQLRFGPLAQGPPCPGPLAPAIGQL